MKKKKSTNLPVKVKSTELITVSQEKINQKNKKSNPLEINITDKLHHLKRF